MALVLYIMLILVVVIGRAVVQYKKTGDFGFRFIKRGSPFKVKLAAILLFLGAAITFSTALIDYKQEAELWFEIGFLGKAVGIVLGLSAIVFISLSQFQMGKSWRIGVDESECLELVTHGIYSHIRNPIYTGVMLFILALIILVPNTLMLLGGVAGCLAIEAQVRLVEEPYLRRLHGERFESYMKETKRYFPWY